MKLNWQRVVAISLWMLFVTAIHRWVPNMPLAGEVGWLLASLVAGVVIAHLWPVDDRS